MEQTGKIVMAVGVLVVLIGGGIYLAGKFGWPLGRLPGDMRFEGENVKVYFPLGSSILFSILLTVILNVVIKWFRN